MDTQKFDLHFPQSFVTFRLARLQSALNAQAHALLKQTGELSLVEWRLILLLSLYGNLSMSQVREIVEIDKGQLSRKIKSMIGKGLLSSERDAKDKRVQHVTLTSKGLALRERVFPVMQTRQQVLLENVSSEELAIFYQVMDKIEAASKRRDIS